MSLTNRLFLFVLLVALVACGADPKASDNQISSSYEAEVSRALEEFGAAGAAVAVVKDDRLFYAKGFGYRNLVEKLPVTPETLFAIGSTTKAFTAATLAILVEEGKLDFDSPVKKYLPGFQLHDTFATERATPRDLLLHRTGLPRHDLVWYGSGLNRAELMDRLKYLEPSADFRSRWQYQNLMYMAAGFLVGETAKTSWEEFTRKRIFEPLGMLQSNFSVLDSQKAKDFALPYTLGKDNKLVQIPFRNIDAIAPAGSINSNLVDMAKWVRFNLGTTDAGSSRILRSETLRELHRPQVVIGEHFGEPDFGVEMYALGWVNQTYRQQRIVWHTGGIDGFRTLVALLPEKKMGIVVVVNSEASEVTRVASFSLIDELLGLERIDWTARIKERKAAAKKPTPPKIEAKPTLDALTAYPGKYTHPAYGELEVKLVDGKLRLVFQSLGDEELIHVGERKFFFSGAATERDFVVFKVNLAGTVEGLEWGLEPELKNPVAFRRVQL